jgi:hypothetical protein
LEGNISITSIGQRKQAQGKVMKNLFFNLFLKEEENEYVGRGLVYYV